MYRVPGSFGPHPKRKAPRRPVEAGAKDAAHLDLIRACPCLACGGGPAEAAHVRYSDALRGKVNPGTGARPADRWTVPLCPTCHRVGDDCQHSGNERVWWERHRIDPLDAAKRLWETSRRLRAQGQQTTFIVETMTAIVRAARRSRVKP